MLCNTGTPAEPLLAKYREQKAELVAVAPDDGCWGKRRFWAADLLDTSGGIVRHDSKKLARLICRAIEPPAANGDPTEDRR